MKRFFSISSAILLTCIFLSSCASMFSKSSYPVSVYTSPKGAYITITDRDNMIVFEGRGPANLHLEASAGYFQPQIYTIMVEEEGYDPKTMVLKSTIDGWYFANLFLGGYIGMLVVDPLTGAMWRIPQKEVYMTLDGPHQVKAESGKNLQIIPLDQVPDSLKDKMERIK